MSASNADAVRKSFARQPLAFEDPTRSFGDSDVVSWMLDNTPTRSSDVVLEVAAGTALFGRSLASRVASVVALDLTPEMLTVGKAAAETAGSTNIVFQVGDVTALSFLDESFDRVISRLAVHHFVDPRVALGEMARCTRLGGTITIIDMVVPEHTDAARFNELETLRDSAHVRALTRAELRAEVESTGLSIAHESTRTNVLDGERWLEQTLTPGSDAATIRAAWSSELDGGAATGMTPRVRENRIEITHTWDLLIAERRAH